MHCDFFGRVLIESTSVEHRRRDLAAMIAKLHHACKAVAFSDRIANVEMTGIDHKPVQDAFRKAGFDACIVHPFASSHSRRRLHPDVKTDDNDLGAIVQEIDRSATDRGQCLTGGERSRERRHEKPREAMNGNAGTLRLPREMILLAFERLIRRVVLRTLHGLEAHLRGHSRG